MLWGTMIGSVMALYPFNRFIKFGNGFFPYFLKTACNLAILAGPTLYVNSKMRERMLVLKKKAFVENRPAFRRFELTGDVLEVNDGYELVDE